MRQFLLGLLAAAAVALPASAQTVERVPHGVVVTPAEGAAKRVRVLAYGDAGFRVTAVPTTDLNLPASVTVTAKPSGDPAIAEAKGVVTL